MYIDEVVLPCICINIGHVPIQDLQKKMADSTLLILSIINSRQNIQKESHLE